MAFVSFWLSVQCRLDNTFDPFKGADYKTLKEAVVRRPVSRTHRPRMWANDVVRVKGTLLRCLADQPVDYKIFNTLGSIDPER